MESHDVRLARIEEGMVALHGKLDRYHSDIKASISPIQKAHQMHSEDITILKRDRFWMFALVSFSCSTGAYAILEMLRK